MATDYIWNNLFKIDKDKELQNILKSVKLFASINKKQLDKLVKHTHLRHYKAGDIIFKEKDPGLGMYIISTGGVKVISNNNILGKETILAELEPGDFFGELALVDEVPRSATTVATKDSQLIAFFRPDLLSLCNMDPVLGNKLLMELSKVIALRLRKTNEELNKIKS